MEDASETEEAREVEQALGVEENSGATATPPYTQDADTLMNDATLPSSHPSGSPGDEPPVGNSRDQGESIPLGESADNTMTETPSNSPHPMPAAPMVSEELHADATIPFRDPTGSSVGQGNAQDATVENPALPVTEETMNPHRSESSGMNIDSTELPNASPGLRSYQFQKKWPNVPYIYKPKFNAVSVQS